MLRSDDCQTDTSTSSQNEPLMATRDDLAASKTNRSGIFLESDALNLELTGILILGPCLLLAEDVSHLSAVAPEKLLLVDRLINAQSPFCSAWGLKLRIGPVLAVVEEPAVAAVVVVDVVRDSAAARTVGSACTATRGRDTESASSKQLLKPLRILGSRRRNFDAKVEKGVVLVIFVVVVLV